MCDISSESEKHVREIIIADCQFSKVLTHGKLFMSKSFLRCANLVRQADIDQSNHQLWWFFSCCVGFINLLLCSLVALEESCCFLLDASESAVLVVNFCEKWHRIWKFLAWWNTMDDTVAQTVSCLCVQFAMMRRNLCTRNWLQSKSHH